MELDLSLLLPTEDFAQTSGMVAGLLRAVGIAAVRIQCCWQGKCARERIQRRVVGKKREEEKVRHSLAMAEVLVTNLNMLDGGDNTGKKSKREQEKRRVVADSIIYSPMYPLTPSIYSPLQSTTPSIHQPCPHFVKQFEKRFDWDCPLSPTKAPTLHT
jgi:hypothetical protein